MSKPFHVGFLLYPNLTQLDMTGPAQVLHRMPGATVHFVWKRIEPVMSDCGLALLPTVTLADCPQLDLICVPGGYGCTEMMADEEVLDWLRRQAAGAQWLTSVCTGSLVLAAAGLLDGYRAGCHWAWGDHLAGFGATYVAERTVVDRNRITAGGVTSGIDFAFRVIEKLHGRDVAESIQLALEYDPQPLGGGTPKTARPEILGAVQGVMAGRMAARVAALEAAAARYQ
ncbi:DJ-1/PfpI family protein [Sandaracinobacteroides saxicola]|uniref:DJ-1/PfpI family protein n=1 Tax=Sandaracinobacteroides saxicola TaxID=2759707 RepID=A0A7G5ILD9_9SPHN|nr:DJ-1/PfpI family protein [Sandaracinobacteroides saxicola]QMW24181.1 DJ-1/PfpI family protein [Sandaracinobacteroides saxicola]